MQKPVSCLLGVLLGVLLTGRSMVWAQFGVEIRPGVEYERFSYNPWLKQQDRTAPLETIEPQLAFLGEIILNHDSTLCKLSTNDELMHRLNLILRRPDSYNYPFAGLKTVSRIYPSDNTFRIFTWHIRDEFGVHKYFGVVQRKFSATKGRPEHIKLYWLNDIIDKTNHAEQLILDHTQWLGALYYKPNLDNSGVLTFDGKAQRLDSRTGKSKIEPVRYYVLLGWNGHNHGSDYKIIEAVTFDDRDTSKIFFGAPIFHFGQMPRARVIFKYNDKAPFSLNQGYIVTKPFRRKHKAIIFDHLSMPKGKNPTSHIMAGADGTLDALVFINKVHEMRKGFFHLLRDVDVYAEGIENFSPKQLRKQQRQFQKMNPPPTLPATASPSKTN